MENRLRGISDCFNAVTGIEEADDPARAAFQNFVAPRKGADNAALSEHHFDVAAEIFRVKEALLERPIVKRKYVGRNLAA